MVWSILKTTCSKPLLQTLLGQNWFAILLLSNHQYQPTHSLPSTPCLSDVEKGTHPSIHQVTTAGKETISPVQMSNKINNHFLKKGKEKQELSPFTSNCSLPPCLVNREIHVTIPPNGFSCLLHFTSCVWKYFSRLRLYNCSKFREN